MSWYWSILSRNVTRWFNNSTKRKRIVTSLVRVGFGLFDPVRPPSGIERPPEFSYFGWSWSSPVPEFQIILGPCPALDFSFSRSWTNRFWSLDSWPPCWAWFPFWVWHGSEILQLEKLNWTNFIWYRSFIERDLELDFVSVWPLFESGNLFQFQDSFFSALFWPFLAV